MKLKISTTTKRLSLSFVFLLAMLSVMNSKATAQTLPISFNFQSATLPAGLSSSGTISTSGAIGSCTVCSPGRIVIAVSGWFQIDVPAVSVVNMNMKSSASARTVTVKYKHGADADYTTAGTISVPGGAATGNAFELVTIFPAIASSSTTSIRLENAASGGEFHIHDVFIDGAAALSTEAEISGFTIPGQLGNETITSATGKVEINVASGTALASVVPSSVSLSSGATINPLATAAQNFSDAVEVPYTVTAQDGTTTKNWTVKVTEVQSSEKEITAFVLSNDQIGNAVINSAAGTISVVMPNAVSLNNLVPVTLTVSANATVSPLASAAQDFSAPVAYTVTAQNTSTKVWTVTVTQITPPASFDDYEAELADFTGTVDNNHTGFTGTGFINFLANGENYIIFNVCQTSAGAQTAKFRYAMGVDQDRRGKLFVNDIFVQELLFPYTNAWTNWAEETAVVTLQAGMNSIKITWDDTDGPNLDKLLLSGTQCAKYSLTVNTTNSGTVAVSPARTNNEYFDVETVTLLAEVLPALTFDNWSGDLTGNTNPAQLAMTANRTVTAHFTVIPTYTLQVNTTGVGSVTLSPAGGVYAAGTTVTLTANTALGSSFQNWTGDASGSNSVTTVVMNANKSVTASFSNATAIDFETPVGFASVNTGSTYPNFNTAVTGGQNAADTFWVNGPTDFDALAWRFYYRNRAYNNQSGTNGVPKAPLVIVFKSGEYPEGTSTSSAWGNHMMTIQEQGDLTIIGENNVTLKFGFNIKRSWNILIRNITFQDYYDDGINIGEPETHHIWIDHCTLGHPTTLPANSEHPDGGIDSKSGASYITISWCLVRNSWKTSLVGHSDNNGSEDIGKLKVTYYANHFIGTNSRNPRVRFGEVHVLNNLEEKVGLYGIAAANAARVVAEGNFFLNTRWPMYADRAVADFRTVYGTNTDNVFTSKTGNIPAVYLKQLNNEYDDSGLPVITAQINPAMLNPGGRSIKFDELNAGAAFDPHSYYTYTAFPASVVRTMVPLFAGANRVNFFTQTSSTPAITTNGTLSAFSQTLGTPSAVQTYTVSAENLTTALTVTPPAGYEVSANAGANWFTNASPLSLAPSAGTIATTTISVRLNAITANNYAGDIVHSSTDAQSVNVAVSGTASANSGNWTIYQANELPGAFTPAFVVSQQTGTLITNTILADPDQAGNNLLHMQTDVASNNQWRQNMVTGAQDITLVIRAKGNPADATLIFDADLDFGGFRWQTRILSNGNYGLATGTSASSSGSLGIDPTAWNIYRFTKQGSAGVLYVNENPVATYTATAVAGTQSFFRFGDGWGVNNINSHIDWVAWDVTGAYSPADQPLPPSLSGGTPEITATGSLSSFTQSIGTASAVQTYTIAAEHLTNDLIITPPAGYEVSDNGGTNWFTNASPLSLTASAGTIATTTISVRLNAVTANSYAGDIVHSSTGAQDVAIAVSGTATNPGNWVIYQANELPGAFTPAFVVSQQTGTVITNTILTDPDQPGNNLLHMQTDVASNNQWRQNMVAGAQDITLVIRAKGNPADATLIFDADLDFGGFRWQTRILSNGNYGLATGTGTSSSGSLGIDPAAWNIYRFTKQGSAGVLYVNENPVATYTATAVAGTQSFFRFGDGWGANNINSHIDWVAWDVTGAYSPADQSLPPGLVPPANPALTVTASLSNFTQIVGTPSAAQTYTVSGTALTTDLTITPPAGYEVSANGGSSWFDNTSPLVLPHSGGTIASTTISVRLNAAIAGPYAGNITHASSGLPVNNVAVNGTASAPTTPTIITTASLNPFNQTVGAPSATQTYTVSGTNLTNNVSITPPAEYEISDDGGSNWYNNSNPLVLVHTAGTLASTTITVRLNAATAASYNGDITHVSTGATTQNVAVTGTTVDPPAITATASLSNFSQTVGTPSAIQTYTASGTNLIANLVITPPAGYEVSANGGTNWFNSSSPLTLTATAGTVSNTTISVRLNAATAGNHAGDITHTSTNATTRNVAVNGTAVDPPTIATTGTLSAFAQTVGNPSATQTYTVSGYNFTGNVTITPPAGYEVSANGGTNWFSNSAPLTLTPTAGTLANTTITVRLNATTAGSYSGNIVHTSPGATTRNVAVSGTVVNPPATTIASAFILFEQTIGAPSAVQQFTIQGSNLVSTVTVTPPTNYEVSLNNINWFSSSNPLVLTATAGSLPTTIVRVRLNATTTGQHNADITIQTSGNANKTIALTGYTHSSFTIGPNPARDVINLYHPFLYSIGEIYIYDATGNQVRRLRTTAASNKTTINISALPAGAYTIEYKRREERETLRFLKL